MDSENHGPFAESALQAVEAPVAVHLHEYDIRVEATYRTSCSRSGQNAGRIALPAPDENDIYAWVEHRLLCAFGALLRTQLEAVLARDHEYAALIRKLVRDRRCVVEEPVEKNEHLEPGATTNHLATATPGYTVSRQTRLTAPITVPKTRR